MSNLTGTGRLRMNRVSHSIWFRVPTDAARAVQTRDAGDRSDDVSVMDHVVPIVMFGAQQTVQIYDWVADTAECAQAVPDTPPFTYSMTYISGSRPCPIQQSCIGVKCLPGHNPTLFVHIQPNRGVVTDNWTWQGGPDYSCPDPFGPGVPAGIGASYAPIPVLTHSPFADAGAQGGAVGNSDNSNVSSNAAAPFGGEPVVSLDHWHHLLLTWDLKAESGRIQTVDELFANQPIAERLTSRSKLYCVLDKVNRAGLELPATWIGSDELSPTADPNTIVCGAVYDIAGNAQSSQQNPDEITGVLDPRRPSTVPIASVSMDYGTIPAAPLWIPGSYSIRTQSRSPLVANQHIELAEYDIYSGRVFTTSNIALFVDAKGDPVPTKTRDKILGFTPTRRLHGSGNWKRGNDTGSSGSDFRPRGKILRYRPDPSLHGPQSPADLKK